MRPDPLPADTMARLRKWGYAPGGSEDMEEAFEERAAVIQFGSGREDLEKARHLLSLLIESERVKQDE